MAAVFDEEIGVEELPTSLPTGAEAARRTELFLRERQVASAREVLIVTGRGNQSAGGVPVVRPAVAKLLAQLRRSGVVTSWQEHTAGSFVVTPAPISALLEIPRRNGDSAASPADQASFSGLDPATRDVLRALAVRSLQLLGASAADSFVLDEMQRQYSALGTAVRPGPNREARLRAAAERALDELDDRE